LPESWTSAQRRALDAGVELLSRKMRSVPADLDAFGTVTVARVARTAGVSRQTVYSRWRSDDDLRLDVLRRLADAHIRSFRSIDHDPWVPTEDWRRTLSFAMGFLAFADRVGPRLPWLAFAPYAGDERVAAELARVARHCIDEAASVTERSLASIDGLDGDRPSPTQRAEIGFAAWLGARRRAQIRLRLDSSPEVWRDELRLTSLLVHVFGGAPGVGALAHLLEPLGDAELPPPPASGR
jgi:AcrR family transcriptional regulator